MADKALRDRELLEREAELAAVIAAADRARERNGRLVTVVGPAGIGKTRLLAGACEAMGALGMRTLRARAGELERDFPFGVARQLVEPVLAGSSPEQRKELLAGAAALAEGAVSGTPTAESGAADPSFAALHGLYWLVANLCSQEPLVIAMDDAHWCDRASLRWLGFLSRRLDGLPLVLMIAWREGEPGSFSELLDELLSDPEAVVLRPAPLSEKAAGSLLSEALGRQPDAAFVSACHRASGGNPHLLRELAAMLAAEDIAPITANVRRVQTLGPESVSRAVLARLARLGPEATKLARAVSVLEGAAELRHAVSLTGSTEAEVVEAADALARAGILQAEPPLEFAHPILRAVVYADIGPAHRAVEHAKAAELLAAAGADEHVIATQLVATEPDGNAWVVDHLRKAAKDAYARGAAEVARDFLARALAEPPSQQLRGELLHELGLAEMRCGERESLGHLSESVELAHSAAERASRARAIAQTFTLLGRGDEAVTVISSVIDDLPEDEVELGLDLEAYLQVSGYASLIARRSVLARSPRFTSDPGAAGALTLAVAANDCALTEGPADRVAELSLRALSDSGLIEATRSGSPAFYLAANSLFFADELERAAKIYTAAMNDASARGSLQGYGSVSCWRSLIAYRSGDLSQAEADARSFLETSVEVVPVGAPLAVSTLIDVMIDRGDVDTAISVVEGNATAVSADSVLALFALESRARLRARRGDHAGALGDLQECDSRERDWGVTTPTLTIWRAAAALSCLALDDREQASRLAGEALEQTRAFGSARSIGIALRVSGQVEGGDEGIERLGQSCALLGRSQARLEHARSLLAYGAALRRSGRRIDARKPLNDGLAQARRCDATAVAEAAYDELRASGARPRKILRSGIESLTASERRVAAMAANGMSNKEIAQALFVTVRTVEVHLHNTYRKLDIGSRAQLPATEL